MKVRLILFLCGLAWLFAVTGGLSVLAAYQGTPGVAATPEAQWPSNTSLQAAPGRATLVMVAHPHCPCTRASIGELNTLMAQVQGKVQVYVLFFKPKGAAARWEQTDLWRSAEAIPGVQAICDEGGIEARRFQAVTSGQTLLFNSTGHLLFNGGITGGRGHAGDNPGRDAVVSLLTTGKAPQHKTPDQTPVFGCSLGDF